MIVKLPAIFEQLYQFFCTSYHCHTPYLLTHITNQIKSPLRLQGVHVCHSNRYVMFHCPTDQHRVRSVLFGQRWVDLFSNVLYCTVTIVIRSRTFEHSYRHEIVHKLLVVLSVPQLFLALYRTVNFSTLLLQQNLFFVFAALSSEAPRTTISLRAGPMLKPLEHSMILLKKWFEDEYRRTVLFYSVWSYRTLWKG